MKMLTAISAAMVLSLGSLAAHGAAIVDLQIEGGGTAQIHQLDNGNLLGLWGFDTRGGDEVTLTEAADLTAGFTSGGDQIVGYFDALFAELAFPKTIAADTRMFDSLWIEWAGDSSLVYSFNGRTRTMGTTVTRDGDPTAVPEPAALGLAALGLFGLIALRRRARA